MVFEHIEKMKQSYTDQYVVVDGSRPELARFQGQTGQVRTVNMSGRALVEFDQHANIGWYDIDVDYLKVVDKPAPKEPTKKAPAKKKPVAKKPASSGTDKLSPLELARMQGAAGGKKKTSEKAKPSTADILASARGGTKASSGSTASPKEPAPKEPSAGKMSTADILAAARNKKAAAAKPDASPPAEMSLAEKLAAARGDKGSSGADAPLAADTPVVEEPTTETTADAESASASPSPAGEVDRNSMSVEQKIDWCRKQDGS